MVGVFILDLPDMSYVSGFIDLCEAKTYERLGEGPGSGGEWMDCSEFAERDLLLKFKTDSFV